MSSVSAIATEVLSALDSGRQIPPFSARELQFDIDTAYAVTAKLREARQARGEKQIGRKIGFTNRNIWPQYGIDRPIWGDMWDTTLREMSATGPAISLAGFSQPQIEPEIAFKLAAAPRPGMDEKALLGCVEWVTQGFELVQSIYPNWKFTAADTIAAGGLHGAFLLGAHVPPSQLPDGARMLTDFEVTLLRNDKIADCGRGANVLGSPLLALRHLVELLAADPHNPPLRAGEIVTTGTLTRAIPVAPGETWTMQLSGIDLPGLSVTFG
jgi:2-oxo-3-hexenedioate decarboxylase